MSQAASKKRKTDTTATPVPTSAPAALPNPYSVPQGSRTPQIPIDPTLQQQQQQQTTPPQQTQAPPQLQPTQQQQYANYYQQYNYANYHPPPAWSAAQAQAQARAAPQVQQQSSATGELDTSDIATLNDAIGSAGVDLRAEEETLRQSHAAQPQAQSQSQPARGRRAKKQGTKAAFDAAHLGTRMRDVASRYTLPNVPEDSVTYLALALRVRLAGLIEGMAGAATHREETGVLRTPGFYADGATPLWAQVVRRDVAKQLALLERVEREEELAARRERKAYAAVGGGQTALPSLDDALPMEQTEEEPKKKKKKPDGPGVTAKNMSEDMKKKLSNAVAAQAAGLGTGKYAWMNAGNIPSGPPVKKAAGATAPAAAQQSGSGWAKPFQSGKKKDEPPVEDTRRAITLRDAIFVIERERGHGGGRGAARGWT